MTEEKFDQLLDQMRDESPSTEEVAAASRRVRDRLTGPNSQQCSRFQSGLGEYVAGGLGEPSRLLLEDHLARCADCRSALANKKRPAKVVEAPIARPRAARWTGWAVAATILLVAVYAGRHQVDRAFAPSGPTATVVSVSGEAYSEPTVALASGATLFEDDAVQIGAGARAILALADGSMVEVNQRTKLSVRSAWSGQTIVLDYGDVLVEAAPQSRGRLRVLTRDSVASVKGTVFAVSSATAGSLVSVVEGSVEVSQSGSQALLQPGEQAASSAALKSVRIEQAIAWSQEAEKYFGLLAELVDLEKDLAQLPGPALRTDARLLRYLPAETLVYFAIPNLNGTIDQAVSLLEERLGRNQALAEWWSSSEGQDLRDVAQSIQTIAPLLGEEIVFALALDPGRPDKPLPLILTELQPGSEDGVHEAIAAILEGEAPPYEVVDGLLLASDRLESLTILMASLGSGGTTEFADEIESRYSQGVSWLMAADMSSPTLAGEVPEDASQAIGFDAMRYLFFERRTADGGAGTKATLTFSGNRTGVASWIAPPGSAGSAEYVSSGAVAAFSASARDPRQALDELLAMVSQNSEAAAELADFEAFTGVSLSQDIAASLGTDLTFAIERPTLPMPGWFVAFEVMNAGALDESARRLVERFNDLAVERGQGQSLSFNQETIDGQTWRSISADRDPAASAEGQSYPFELHWTYDGAYLVGSIDRALAMRAIGIRQSGPQLVYSDVFERSYPSTSTLHHSGFVWFNSSGLAADLASLVASPALSQLLQSREPVLVVFDGEAEQISAASRTRLTSALLDALLLAGVGDNSAADSSEQP